MTTGYAGLLLRAVRQQRGLVLGDLVDQARRWHVGMSVTFLRGVERGDVSCPVTDEVIALYERVLEVPLVEAVAALAGVGAGHLRSPPAAPGPGTPTSGGNDEQREEGQ